VGCLRRNNIRTEREDEKNELENKLKKKSGQKRAKKARDEKKRKINALFEDNPELLIQSWV